MMLKSALADEPQQFLQSRDTHDPRSSKGFQRIVGKFALADVTGHLSLAVVGRKAREAHGAALHLAHASPKRIFLANCSGNNLLEVHADIAEEMLRQVAAVKADCFDCSNL